MITEVCTNCGLIVHTDRDRATTRVYDKQCPRCQTYNLMEPYNPNPRGVTAPGTPGLSGAEVIPGAEG